MKRSLRMGLLCLALGFGSFVGMQMRPEEIEELMWSMNQAKVAQTLPEDDESGDDILAHLQK